LARACSATDVFIFGRRSIGFLLLEPFLFVLAIRGVARRRNENIEPATQRLS